MMETPEFISKVLRIEADIIYSSTLKRASQTAQKIKEIIKTYKDEDIEIITTEQLAIDNNTKTFYKKMLEKEAGRTVLLISHEPQFKELWDTYYNTNEKIKKLEIVKLPSYTITNELDKWILAEINQLGINLETEMDKYFLDTGAKAILGFIDKLNNRYIRRSRRRFWAS
ncbi:hypothetical protein KKH82_04230 [Patescibacteria group bacterium]|nr:hypothetical protein [Patescibacteria group bacterium]